MFHEECELHLVTTSPRSEVIARNLLSLIALCAEICRDLEVKLLHMTYGFTSFHLPEKHEGSMDASDISYVFI